MLLLDVDSTNSINTPDATDNKTFGLVINIDDNYPDNRFEYWTQKCRTLTNYNNNNNFSDSENNIDNNSNYNDHDFSLQDYYNGSVLTENKLYIAINCNANNDAHSNSIHYYDGITQKAESNNKSGNSDNNSSNSNNNPCADSEDNNDNNKDGDIISSSIPIPSNSNADNAPHGRNNKNNMMRLPTFISHPNGIVVRVFNEQQQLKTTKSSSSTTSLKDLAGKPDKKIRLPSFISYPNGIVLRVFTQKQVTTQRDEQQKNVGLNGN